MTQRSLRSIPGFRRPPAHAPRWMAAFPDMTFRVEPVIAGADRVSPTRSEAAFAGLIATR